MKETVVLIGPVRSGKTTLGKRLAERLARTNASLDDHYSRYRELVVTEMGASREPPPEPDATCRELWKEAGRFGDAWRAEMPVSARVLERFLADHRGRVIDLGAGHSVYDGALLERVSTLLEPYENLFLLLPVPDPDQSIAILHERLTYPMHVALNPVFVRHPANRKLAKQVVYTEGRSPEETCEEILAAIRSASTPRPPSS